ncbi:MAG: hypothetical protein K6T78_07490 [Alicyclobacillus sp.]|nr:hypothetical protein [Alicyclobacillus sp.]
MRNLVTVYAVLLILVIGLLWLARRFSTGGRGATALRDRLVEWLRSPSRSQSPPPTAPSKQARPDPADADRVLAVLDDLYGEFRDETAALRRDFAAALEALHREVEERLQALEQPSRPLDEGVDSAQRTSLAPESGRAGTRLDPPPMKVLLGGQRVSLDAGGSTLSVEEGDVARRTGRSVEDVSGTASESAGEVSGGLDAPTSGAIQQEDPFSLSASHQEALARLEAGQPRDRVARELGIGLGEVAILERVFLRRQGG